MKGIAAILIVLSHAHYYVADLGALRVLKPFGYIGVSLFFFCSGYGVMRQYMNNAAYLDGFLKKRFKSVYYPYIAVMILWLICNVVFQNTATDSKAIVQFLLIDLMLIKTNLPFSWYVLVVLAWYTVFFCVVVVLKRADRIFQAILAINALWYIIGMTMTISAFYYNGTCCITLGCYIALKEQEMFVPKRKTCLLSSMAFGASVLFLYLFGDKSSILHSAAVIAGSISFVWLLYTVGFLFSFKSELT